MKQIYIARHYVRVSPFALASVISALSRDYDHARNITISLEDDDLLVAYDEPAAERARPLRDPILTVEQQKMLWEQAKNK